MKNPQSSVRYSVIAPGREVARAALQPSAPPRWIAWKRVRSGFSTRSSARNSALGLRGVVGRVVADVDVDRDEAALGPRVDREMRLGEQHRAGDALRLELEETVADDRQAGGRRPPRRHSVAQRFGVASIPACRQGSRTIRLTDGFRPSVVPPEKHPGRRPCDAAGASANGTPACTRCAFGATRHSSDDVARFATISARKCRGGKRCDYCTNVVLSR